jgi:NADH dehydrogenase (ubiquinone) Fe-S protein 6
MPPIAVDSWVAICDGNAAGLGHPREYIQLKKLNFREPSSCKYCGLRYLRKGSSDFAHAHE